MYLYFSVIALFLSVVTIIFNKKIRFVIGFFLLKLANNMMSLKQNEEKRVVKIDDNKIIIECVHRGKVKYHVLPYNRSDLARHSKYEVHLVDHIGNEMEITQIPGTKYTHTAKDLGAKRIKVTNKLSGEVRYFDEDQHPII